MEYSIFKISKHDGRYRTIYSVDNETKLFLRQKLPYLNKKLKELDKINVNYAFVKGRNCVLGAMKHIGYNFSLSLDIENYFDSVTPSHIYNKLDYDFIKTCFIDGAPRQGLPTSPLIATIAFLECDELITNALNKNNLNYVYTRYADDLTISFNKKKEASKIHFIVNEIIENYGFKINKNKTKLQNINNGRIIINGIAIDKYGIHPTRKTKKKIRAAIHQKNSRSERGLKEWAKCKTPNLYIKE